MKESFLANIFNVRDGDIIRGYVYKAGFFIYDLDAKYNAETMHWPMFRHDAQRTGRYIYHEVQEVIEPPEEEPPKSILINAGENPLIGRFYMKAEKKENGNWQHMKIVVWKRVEVPGNGYFALDKEWAAAEYFIADETGQYRVYAALLDEQENIIETSEGKLESTYEFSVV